MKLDWFAGRLLDWFDRHGRRHLPWQQDIDAYRVWVSEIMLQQTQVSTVIPYYQRFLERFPDAASLAGAELDDVLHHWSGLGYYARGRNLHRAAQRVLAEHAGRLPDDVAALTCLPGIGRSTAGAIAAIAYGVRAPILDGNVKRVLTRFHAVPGYPGDAQPLRALWALADANTPQQRVGDYTQAIMDLGATLCTRSRPDCGACPVQERCVALQQGSVHLYPERKAKRDKPVRAARMFVIRDGAGHCLLQQRPPDGLWGGLWTPPERAVDASVSALCAEFGINLEDVQGQHHGATFRHTFSHFHLDIEPVYVTLRGRAGGIAERADVCWYHPSASGQPRLGLAAPASKLLATLAPVGAISRSRSRES
ncbi:MAG: A/G-specific adenine glycosylase [Pseudomonadales bacterium]